VADDPHRVDDVHLLHDVVEVSVGCIFMSRLKVASISLHRHGLPVHRCA
jgi:hypothetical protein